MGSISVICLKAESFTPGSQDEEGSFTDAPFLGSSMPLIIIPATTFEEHKSVFTEDTLS